jgi:LPS export ABC transporter permease LptG
VLRPLYPGEVRILSRYLLGEFLAAAAVVLLGFAFVWAAADTLLHIDELGSEGLAALQGVLLRSVDVVPIALPLAAAIAITWSLARAARFREITAMRCGGIALRRALAPVLAASLLLGVALAFAEDRVLVPAHRTLRGVGSEDERSEGPRLVEQRWWYARGDWLLSAARFDAAASALEDVTAFRLGPDHQIEQRIDARRARSAGGGRWELEEAEVRSFSAEGIALRNEPRYDLELGLERSEMAAASEPALMSLRALWRASAAAPQEQAEARALRLALHERLARPLAVLLLVLAAIPFALADAGRGDGFAKALLQSLSAAAGFWALWTLALVGGQSGWGPPGLALWGLLALCGAAGALRYRRIDL